MKKNKGFTLIELLVVIAIIGILSAVVLASLNTARNKAKDASVQGQMSGMRTAAEIFYGNNGNKYQTGATAITACSGAGTAFADTVSNMSALISATTNAATAIDCGIAADGSAWSVAATLPSGSGFFCVDSTGAAKKTQASGATAYTALTGAGTAAHTAAGATSCN
jgi:type IV pilus assembly protein PilA